MTEDNQWQEAWDARLQGLEAAFGKSDDIHLHATIPFDLGIDLRGQS